MCRDREFRIELEGSDTSQVASISLTPLAPPYGIDFSIRDPFGNAIRIGQMFEAGA